MKKLTLLIVALIIVLGLAWVLSDLWSRKQLNDACKEWPLIDRSLADFSQLFPRISKNQSARALNVFCRQLGLDIVEDLDTEAERSSQEEQKAFQTMEPGLREYLEKELERPTGLVEIPPADIVAFLTKSEEFLVDISHLLVNNDLPEWTLDVEGGLEAPVPNLLWHLKLNRLLLVQALYLHANGNPDQAWSYLHASARLADSLFTRPEIISQLIAIAEANRILVVMRKMNIPIPSWALSWPTHNLEHEMLMAYTGGARHFLVTTDTGLISIVSYMKTMTGEEKETIGVGTHILSVVSRPYIRLCGAQVIIALKRVLRDLMREGLCADQPPNLGTIEEQLPSWVVLPGKTMAPHFWESGVKSFWETIDRPWNKLHELMIHLVGTRAILAAKAAKATSPTVRWPETLPEMALPCESLAWSYTVASDGSVTFQYPKPLHTEKPGLPASSLKYIDSVEK